MKKIMEFIKEYHGIIGGIMVFIGMLLMLNSLIDSKIEMYQEKLKNEKLIRGIKDEL